MKKKVVIIIEDDEIAFNDIKSVISSDCDNKQRYDTDFDNFREILRNSLIQKHTDPKEPGRSKKYCLRN